MNPGSSSSRSPACPCTVNPTETLNIWVESRCAKPLPVPASGQRNFCSHCCCRCRGDECDLCSNRCCVDSHSAHLRIRCSSDHGSRIESTWVARHQGHHAAPDRTASIRSGSPQAIRTIRRCVVLRNGEHVVAAGSWNGGANRRRNIGGCGIPGIGFRSVSRMHHVWLAHSMGCRT